MTRVAGCCRLHFGLLHAPRGGGERWPGLDGNPGLPIRHFGGVGLMVDEPGIAVRVERADEWRATGPLADRALAFARQAVMVLDPESQSPFSVTVERCPPEHVGFGVGTALGMAIARAVDRECGGSADYRELAKRVGRGGRSAIGVHGSEYGGLIVEGGKRAGEELSPLIAHHPLPEHWQVSLHQPSDADHWFGDREREAFRRLRELPEPDGVEVERLCRLIVQGILPGIASGDLALFGEAVFEYNARIGDLFAPVQGGRYSTPGIAAKVAELRGLGFTAVGQSSWGPTVFAIRNR